MLDTFSTIALWAIPAILAITLHEAAHGYVAKLCGDRTAWVLGRVTMNPIRHIDPVGTLLVPAVLRGSNPETMRPPSSGRIGNKLNAMSIKFTEMPA